MDSCQCTVDSVDYIAIKSDEKTLFIMQWYYSLWQKNSIYINITRLSSHLNIPNSQESNGQKKAENLEKKKVENLK